MIIYDHSALGGWEIIFHYTGSALFTYRSLGPAFLSAVLAAVVSNEPTVLAWFAPRILNGSVIFSAIQFLVSLIVVNRVREASQRFNATQEAFLRFYSSLISVALIITTCIDNPKAQPSDELVFFRIRFLRWIRALHVLALEEFQGYESPKYRMGTLTLTEEILLFKEKRKFMRVLHWLYDGLMKVRTSVIGIDAAIESNVWRMMGDVYSSYANARRMSSQIYPFPLAQSSLAACICYGALSPFAFGTMMPESYFLAPFVAFASVWLTFAFNLAAQMLEWPFDGDANNLCMNYYAVRFIKDVGNLEYGIKAPPLQFDLKRIIPEEAVRDVDYDLPHKRPHDVKKDLNDWLKRAQKDVIQFQGERRLLRAGLLPVDEKAKEERKDDLLGEGIPALRARGKFKALW